MVQIHEMARNSSYTIKKKTEMFWDKKNKIVFHFDVIKKKLLCGIDFDRNWPLWDIEHQQEMNFHVN